MLEHGGNLNDAVARCGRPRDAWLDLSTGINPHSYPVPVLTADAWHRLPESNAALLRAAQSYYGASSLLPVAGTQAAIQALPRLRPPARVIVASPAYAEHAHQWARNGHAVREIPYAQLESVVDACDVMVVCNPNNPTGDRVASSMLLQWAERLAGRGGWLIVDEAFGDATPEESLTIAVSRLAAPPRNLLILRSVGKFFGLAGLRLGFVLAHAELLEQLSDAIGPWTISGPAQQIGAAALSDRVWQIAMRDQLLASGQRLQQLLASYGIVSGGCALYRYWPETQSDAFAEHMAQQGIWIRKFAHGVRIGLPPDESGWQRLHLVLATWNTLKGSA